MAIQHAGGTLVNTTFTGATRANIADGISTALQSAGWTLASSSGSDYKLDSAVSPQGLQMRVRVWDPGTGNCAQIRIFNVGETSAPAQSVFLLPGAGKTFRVIANRYQAFVLVPGSTTAREFAAFGLPCLPGFLSGVITEAGWLHGNMQSDTDAGTRVSFRTELFSYSGNMAVFCNGNAWATPTGGNAGNIRLRVGGDMSMTNWTDNLVQWHDGSYFIDDAIIAWGLTALADKAMARGQLWGAFVDSAARTADTTFTFDDGQGSHTYFVITSNNSASTSIGTLCVAID